MCGCCEQAAQLRLTRFYNGLSIWAPNDRLPNRQLEKPKQHLRYDPAG